MNAQQIRDAEVWARKQAKEVIFEFPDRKPGEAPANAAQRHTIRSLFPNINEVELNNLGEWQAENVIKQMREAQAEFNLEKVLEYVFTPPRPEPPAPAPKPAPSSFSDFVLALVVMLIVVVLMGRLITGSWGGIFQEIFGR